MKYFEKNKIHGIILKSTLITWNYSQGHLVITLKYSQGHMDYLEGNYARNRAVGGARPKVATVEGTMAMLAK